MRALVSLYHQCDTFVTPENLSQRIDEAFVSQRNRVDNNNRDVDRRSFAELKSFILQREQEPRHFFGKGIRLSPIIKASLASSSPNSDQQRKARAMEALVGVSRDGKPLWTAVQENASKIEKQLQEDQQQGD
jgi:hypothetical protein